MTVHRRQRARQDIIDIADYLDRISQAVSDRFLDQQPEKTVNEAAGRIS
jgi:hypothetical protein